MAPRLTNRQTEDNDAVIPLRFGDDPLLWASWLYYEEGLTQGAIAEQMGVSRPSVNAYLADARSRGIVNIDIAPDMFRTLTISVALRDHFNLQDCLVIPTHGDERSLIDRLGGAGAKVLARNLRSGDTLAVTWGRTVLSMADQISHPGLKDVRVVQATGGTTAQIPWTPEACASHLAKALNARAIPISAPAIVSSAKMREMLVRESVLAEQLGILAEADRIVMGISSLRPESTIHTSGFLEGGMQHSHYQDAVGSLTGRFISARGEPVIGPMHERTIGLGLDQLRAIPQRIAIAGGMDKVAAILAALRGGYVSILVTDIATGRGILNAEGYHDTTQRPTAQPDRALRPRTHVKKLINNPKDAVDETLRGAVLAHEHLIAPVPGSKRAIRAIDGPKPGKVAIVIGGGAGHEPAFWGYVGAGMADAAVVGNTFASPPPDPIIAATRAVDGGAGVLYIYGNFSGDVMNFGMAAEIMEAEGVKVRSIITTDDVASSPRETRSARRGVAGTVFTFKIAGAAAARMLPLETCEALAKHTNARTYTMGLALEPSSLPETRQPSFELGPDDMEIGVGVHGEPGVERRSVELADTCADLLLDRVLEEMPATEGDEVALLVNSLGSIPNSELYIVLRRVRQRLKARGIGVHCSYVGSYYTSLDMVGMSLSVLHLDSEIKSLLEHPCRSVVFSS
ncbi:MAG: bifunctional sugar-binding transcriptional regulator/dihydroxyacetone kinase subunit DhaK [Pseudotabrizicola sp.]|uniref:bifunctional sugar-binding transcriptional regulator/dihydroxyacetone kinase subunit DhaK n=1 Tax=Pseudotabrizicola sp. TaxID=2939647 RepID=UPI00272FE50F|nr:bifunctional sugar-binding transcriptional regulator/dihydroxyacetone kinase subunit DhaK [Pseudotabrizicola sp.]MDP2079609.1 bifunctional sugar-binding transcriptional regulator/dihydroxyacetone kinase subunit DhaK [Pseudotabrizicola sp.]MDZ7576378.1 bifunctional sugar-binding transcriptional regulator/dihydroxyacetone kinase subunit DhaK [Pseudotabrizicola sp.]